MNALKGVDIIMVDSRLSICIPTYNRNEYLVKTLEKFIPIVKPYQISICISDNSDNDKTEKAVEILKKEYPHIFYKRNERNLGIDRNIIAAISMSQSKYVWIFSDDDEPKDCAIERILNAIIMNENIDAFIINSVPMSNDMSQEISDNLTGIYSNIIYDDSEKLLEEISWYTTFLGALVIKKEFMSSVDYNKYLDTVFVHVGILFEGLKNNKRAMFIAEPLIKYRTGNASWSNSFFEIQLNLWRKTINLLPTTYKWEVKEKAINSVVFRFVTVGALVAAREAGGLGFTLYTKVILPYIINSKIYQITNLKIFIVASMLLLIPGNAIPYLRRMVRCILR